MPRRQPRPHRVRDVAEQSGLSEATVDRVLNGRGTASARAVRTVEQALLDLDRQQSQVRIAARTFVLDVVMQAPHRFSAAVRSAVEAELPGARPAVVRARFDLRESADPAAAVASLDAVGRRGRVSHGVLLKAPDDPEVAAAARRVVARGIPVVTLVTDVHDSGRAAYVGLDNAAAGRTAAYLVSRWLGRSLGTVLVTMSRSTFFGERSASTPSSTSSRGRRRGCGPRSSATPTVSTRPLRRRLARLSRVTRRSVPSTPSAAETARSQRSSNVPGGSAGCSWRTTSTRTTSSCWPPECSTRCCTTTCVPTCAGRCGRCCGHIGCCPGRRPRWRPTSRSSRPTTCPRASCPTRGREGVAASRRRRAQLTVPCLSFPYRFGPTLAIITVEPHRAGEAQMSGHRRTRLTSRRARQLSPTALVLSLVVTLPLVAVGPQARADETPAPAPTSTTMSPPPGPTTTAGTVVIEGAPQVGGSLTAVTDGWSPDLTLTYQWTADGVPIAGADGATYLLTAAELSRSMAVVVTSHRDGAKVDEVTSGPVGPVAPGTFGAAPAPSVVGTLRVGQVLTAGTGAWQPEASFGYQWLANGVPVTGATGRTYLLQAADRTKRISVTVTGRRAGYTSAVRTSPASAPVDYGIFAAAPSPVVSGTVQTGSWVTVTTGAWSPAATYTYQWKVDGRNVVGQTSSRFYLDASRLGHSVSVAVAGRRPGFLTVIGRSSLRGPVTRPFTSTATPAVRGFFRRVGQPVTVLTGTWGPTATLAIQWRRDGVAIAGATGTAYRPTTADLGKRLTVAVTGRRSTYTTTVRTSAATPAIQGPAYGFTATGQPATPAAAAYAPATITLMTDAQWARIKASGVWRSGECPGYRTTFRRVEVPYWGFDGKTHRGWVTVNADVSSSTAKLFNALYAKRFPLHRVEGIEMFGGWDWLASKANVTTAANCRRASEQNAPNGNSPHAWGRAIDLNPVQNPYINPRTGAWDPNAPAASSAPGTIRYGGTVWQLFRSYRWDWSGTDSWKDYMHFDTGYPSTTRSGFVVTSEGDVLGRGPVPGAV